MKVSICTTNYNCAHALERHLSSVYDSLKGLDFEYLVVDNFSRDDSLSILRGWATNHNNMTIVVRRCTMGEGRQIAFSRSRAGHIMVLDTDVVYNAALREFVDAYFRDYARFSVQALYAGLFPREQWIRAGGRRSLNSNEDVDMWFRLSRLGTMRWYPAWMGENLKEPSTWGSSDYLSHRYSRIERIARLARREWDFFKTRDVNRIDLKALIAPNIVDLGLVPILNPWPMNRTRRTRIQRAVQFVREFKQAVLTP